MRHYDIDIENELWQWIVANDIASDRELNLVTDIAGYSENTLTQVVFVRTGFRNYSQCYDWVDGETDERNIESCSWLDNYQYYML